MEAQALLVLTLSLLFMHSIYAVTFTVKNNCPYTVWPGTLTSSGPALDNTGFELEAQGIQTLDVQASWSGRLWGRTGCSTDDSGRFTCATADCASGQIPCNGTGAIPPATLMEITLNGDGNQDFYDISLVDGFNVPISMTPSDGGCSATSCPADINAACPPELAVKGADGSVIACKSACLAFGDPQYCCTGDHNTPETCSPTQYSEIFKTQCPQAYSYAYDDKSSTVTCPSGGNYVVTFCP
ncbi:Thaumatin family [Dillenia turbinata]|uniref:Thaumatin family n=1 Tax=Dillenia turbinata TaxID=194707 RepID=A0AAN8YYK9_9MAGN